MTILAILTLIGAAISAMLLRPGGVYNPKIVQPMPNITPTPPNAPTRQIDPSTKVYNAAVSFLGEHLAADTSIPVDERCVTAVVFVLRSVQYQIPVSVAGVNGLIDWLVSNGFQETTLPVPGCIISAHNPDKNIPDFAHAGIVARHGIISNTSFPIAGFMAGEFAENYSLGNWEQFFNSKGSETRFFVPA